MTKKRLLTLLPLLLFFLLTQSAEAFTITQPPNSGIDPNRVPGYTPTNPSSLLQNILNTVIGLFFLVGAIGVVVMMLWGAVQWIMSGGEKEGVAKAKARITNALIGLVLLALAFVIITVVGTLVGFNPLGQLVLPSFTETVRTNP